MPLDRRLNDTPLQIFEMLPCMLFGHRISTNAADTEKRKGQRKARCQTKDKRSSIELNAKTIKTSIE